MEEDSPLKLDEAPYNERYDDLGEAMSAVAEANMDEGLWGEE